MIESLTDTNVPYWFLLLCVTAQGHDRKAQEAQDALRILTRAT